MKYFGKTCLNVILFPLLTVSAVSWSIPITYDFSGTVTDEVLVLNGPVKKTTTHPQWNGQTVTGQITFDFLDAVAEQTENLFSYYGSKTRSGVNWLSLRIQNPDGTFYDTDNAAFKRPSASKPYRNMAFTMLTHFHRDYYGVPQSDFIVMREYQEASLTISFAELGLRANGDNVGLLTSSAYFDDLTINPEFANMHNYGHVTQGKGSKFNYDYYFTIDSFERVDVPEPSTLLVFLLGLFMIKARGMKLSYIAVISKAALQSFLEKRGWSDFLLISERSS